MSETVDDEREEELDAISAIYPELIRHDTAPFRASLDIAVAPSTPLTITFPTATDGAPVISILTPPSSDNGAAETSAQPTGVELKAQTAQLSHLPPLHLDIELPSGYPADIPPKARLNVSPAWLPLAKLQALEDEVAEHWEEYGHTQVLYLYIDSLVQAASRGFDLAENADEPFTVALGLKTALLEFSANAALADFEQGSYDCGICLEPKKGSACYRMRRCGHVFCVGCLQDFYNDAITRGEVTTVRCLDTTCGKEDKKRRKKERTLNPSELLAIPIEHDMVKRYVEMKRKKKLESDKTTAYCPRKWCQGAAKSKKFPKITDLSQVPDSDSEAEDELQEVAWKIGDDEAKLPPPSERLAVCEDCNLAFCRVCFQGWHGEIKRCWPRNPAELTEEEQKSFDFIRANTSACPYCSVPCLKSMGCNHMTCFQCNTHFCYLCSSWLDKDNPYQHFNNPKKDCFQRLWELEEGDDGQGANFQGARMWEAQNAAIRAAQEDLANEANEVRGPQNHIPNASPPVPPAAPDPPADAMADLNINPHYAARPAGAPRAHPRQRRHTPPNQHPVNGQLNLPREDGEQPGQMGLQRFLRMVHNDVEDEWDSDEMNDDDEEFVIPFAR